MSLIYPTILCGGVGTRLWPLSRRAYPKQFLPLVGDDSLLQATLRRTGRDHGFGAPVVVASEETRFLVAGQLQELGAKASALILEPAGRNTAPAAAVAALHLREEDPDALMLVLPADHHIADAAAFREAVAAGTAAAAEGYLVTFGIDPAWPETGYGYIQRGARAGDLHEVERFVEKPSPARARDYVDSGRYYWNAGIFLFTCARYLEALEHARPDIFRACEAAMGKSRVDLDFIRLDRREFLECPAQSIDYAVLEGSDALRVVPADIGWSDIGSWEALRKVGTPDGDGNVGHGDVMLEGCRDCYVHSDDGLCAVIGMSDVIVVRTRDALLVSHRERTQEVRHVVAQLDAAGRHEHLVHETVHRPWGSYETIHRGERHQVKHLLVDPGAQLSRQKHNHRAEHWVVVRGTAEVERGDERLTLSENQSTYIPLGVLHRLRNPGSEPLSIIEVQSGDYLGEDDIVRVEDDYDRLES